jgi:hypothetical protein
MDEEMKVIPVDLENGKYVIEISADFEGDLHDILSTLDEWIDGGGPFLVLCPGLKLTRVDKDDIQEKT